MKPTANKGLGFICCLEISRLFEMPISELEVLLPVKIRHIMLTRAHVVTDGVTHGLIDLWHFRFRDPVFSQQSINRVRMNARQKFALRVCPSIFLRAGNINRARCHQSNQLVLVDREQGFPVVVVGKISAKPMRERGVDASQRFPKSAPAQCRTPTP